jgi:flavodoxin
MFEIIYYSMTGNTKKVAEAIAAELDVSAEDACTTGGKLAKNSFLFLGSGNYFPFRGRGVRKIIASNDFNGRKVALFGTEAGGKCEEVKALEKMVAAEGAKVVGKFCCKGKLLFFINRKHPTRQDLENARKFARKMKALK